MKLLCERYRARSHSFAATLKAIPLLLALLVPLYSRAAEPRRLKFSFAGKAIAYDSWDAGPQSALVIVLHGSSGPEMPLYYQQAEFFARKGFTTVLLHYFDVTAGRQPSDENYKVWAGLVEAFARQATSSSDGKPRKVFLVGYSLGASVALAAGSEGAPVTAIAEWYGSLPDEFFNAMTDMPPLLVLHGSQDRNIPVSNAEQLIKLCGLKKLTCDSHIYSDQGHGFSGSALTDADARTLEFFSKRFTPAKVSAEAP